MVLIAAAICTKSGKTIISRQFVEMTKARIEGLLAAFPKLMVTGKQHTFVETDSVRYVYQPLEKLYMLLITTKASNILEDLETLRLFSKVTPEYCRTLDEKEILENAFELIFAFDEIIALGYRESVNLSQIKTFVEMDSHEEKLFQAVRQTQEREAKQKMREKAKELQMQRLEANRKGLVGMGRGGSGGFGGGSSEGFGSGSGGGGMSSSSSQSTGMSGSGIISDVKSSMSSMSKPAPSRNAMKLGGKSKDVDSFVDQLKNEGEKIANLAPVSSTSGSGAGGASSSVSGLAKPKPVSDVHMEGVHLKVEDKLSMQIGRDGGLQQFELIGLLTLRVTDDRFGRIRVKIGNEDAQGVQMQTHPNVDKELFRAQSQLGLKNPSKPFPLNTDVGVLKWRLQTQEESAVPLQINCWPSENGEGGCDVNIEYELEHKHLELQDVVIAIPLPMNVAPTIAECDGDYKYEARKNLLLWTLPVVNGSSKQGAMEFSVPSSIPGDFFPIQVSFHSRSSYARLKALDVVALDEEGAASADPVKFSTETYFYPEKYEIV